ncbi:mycofactocin precursor MftA [Branchiibius cervicis]|uniref:Mycofactocin MftA n=1 Tax=Branchiibius cervicis TaxID=908252 RepID=A0ABW2AQ50_9MICO
MAELDPTEVVQTPENVQEDAEEALIEDVSIDGMCGVY